MSTASDPPTVPGAGAIAELRAELEGILARLDQLGLFRAGAYLAMSIHCLPEAASTYRVGDCSKETPCQT